MLIIILLVLICIFCWMWFIKPDISKNSTIELTVTVLTTLCAGVAIALAICLSNPSAKTVEELRLQREIIVDGLEHTNNEYLYTKFYIDAQELNVNKQRYENKKNSLWVGWFQDRRYEYVDYIDLEGD